MIDYTKPVKTRSGLKVTIWRTDFTGAYPVAGTVHDGNQYELLSWSKHGEFDIGYGSDLDLIQDEDQP